MEAILAGPWSHLSMSGPVHLHISVFHHELYPLPATGRPTRSEQLQTRLFQSLNKAHFM